MTTVNSRKNQSGTRLASDFHGLTIAIILDVDRPADFKAWQEFHFDRDTPKATEREFEDAVAEMAEEIKELFYGF